MSLLSEAIARYHKLIESEPYIDLAWAHALEERIKSEKLGGRSVSPVLRPHLLTNRDYRALVKASETLLAAIGRVSQLVLATPALLARAQMLPAERMLAAVDPGYGAFGVTALLDTALEENSLHVSNYAADVPAGVLYGDALANQYYDAPPVREFRKKYKLKKVGGLKHLLAAMLKAYRDFGGRDRKSVV